MMGLSWLLKFLSSSRSKPYTRQACSATTSNVITMNESRSPSFIPLPADVLDTKSVLWRKGLPVELIDSIIDFAEYWPHLVTEVETDITVCNNSKWLYLQTQPIPGLFTPEGGEDRNSDCLVVGDTQARTLNPVRKIVFRTWSHDQGWSSNLGRGTYEGSFSWFEAFFERPLSIAAIQDAASLPHPVDITDDRKIQGLQSLYGKHSWRTISIPTIGSKDGLENVATEKSVWYIQNNVHAKGFQTRHEVVWVWTDYHKEEVVSTTGAWSGGGLVRGLKPGDRLNVVACAEYPGWQNSVQKMQVEVFYAI